MANSSVAELYGYEKLVNFLTSTIVVGGKGVSETITETIDHQVVKDVLWSVKRETKTDSGETRIYLRIDKFSFNDHWKIDTQVIEGRCPVRVDCPERISRCFRSLCHLQQT